MAHHSFASAHNHHSLDGSFRKSHTIVSGSSSSSSTNTSSSSSSGSRRHYLKELDCVSRFVDNVEEWVSHKMRAFACPFTAEELRELDVATEAVLFQQLFRMPLSPGLSQVHYLALHHFLHALFAALWPTFWRKSRPPPFLLTCPRRRPRSKFYTLPEAVAKGAVHDLCGFALMSGPAAGWGRALLFVLFKQDILSPNEFEISAPVVCEALFYGFHMLASRRLGSGTADAGRVFVLVVDSRYGGVVTLGGDLAKLEWSSADPFRSAVEWVKSHADVAVSPADLVWNKLGNPNWRDTGALRLVLATFHSMAQWSGPPRRSVASLASEHGLRLEKRWMECWQVECNRDDSESALGGEIAEADGNESSSGSRLRLKEGEMVVVDDRQKSAFRVQKCGIGGNKNAYSARAACGDDNDDGDKLVALYVGAHPSRLEPCWEDMSVWYQVQRQTKVLNILSQRACQYLPRVVAWGRVLHPGPCQKQGGGRCDHPWCGTPILATSPVGEALSSVVEREGWLTGEEAVRCCRDCLGALSSAAAAGVQHGDMCPESIIRVSEASGSRCVVTGWGRAVVEGRDGGGGGAAINLRFSSGHALQHGKVCPSSDVESLLYVLLYACGGSVEQQETIESALQWRDAMWAQRRLQNRLGQLSPILKAFADYVDTLYGTPYPVDFNFWLSRFSTTPDSFPC